MKKVSILFFCLLILISCASPAYRRGESLFAQGNYREALEHYQMALNKARTDSDRWRIQKSIDATKSKIVDDVLKRASEACGHPPFPTVQSLEKAISILEEEAPYDDRQRRISKKIEEYRDDKESILLEVQNAIHDADGMVDKGAYFKALETLRKAQKKDRENTKLSDKIVSIERFAKKQGKAYIDEIDALLSIGNAKEAKGMYDKLILIDPHHPRLDALKEEIKTALSKQLISEIRILENQNKWFKAYQVINKYQLDGQEEKIARIKAKGKHYYYNKAKTYLDSDKVHRAYVASFKAKEFDPIDSNVLKIFKKCEDYIEKEIQLYIALSTFNAPASDPKVGTLFSSALIKRLFRDLPYGINIIEREKVDLLMAEKNLDLKSIGDLLSVDMIVNGKVSVFKVDRDISERMVATKVKIKKEEKPNPEFSDMYATFGARMREWPYIPEMRIKKDTFKLVKYKKGEASLKAFISGAIRIFDTRKADIVYEGKFHDSITKSDVFQESVKGTNISEDPLELLTEEEIKIELQNKVIGKIVDVIIDTFKNREERFLQRATSHIERKEYPEAITLLTQGHLYSKRAKKDNQHTQKIYDLMIDLTEGD